MLGRLFPEQIGNDYRGSVAAIWLLVPLAFIKALQGANVMGAQTPTSSRQWTGSR